MKPAAGQKALEELGYTRYKAETADLHIPEDQLPGRIIAEHKERYLVGTADGEVEAEITGNMRFTAESRKDFPAVGDWVTLIAYDPGFAIINEVLPRYSIIKRQAVGQYGEVQIIGTNIDCALIMQAADRDFNPNRLERYITICHSSGVKPVVVLTKTDLTDQEERSAYKITIQKRLDNIPVVAISNETREGYVELTGLIEPGLTYCMLGSSGVGKSTLLNNLAGREMMKTDHISSSTSKGRHVSSHRELTVLENGGILIDNPGMREVGVVDDAGGVETTFDRITELSGECRFADCTHINEKGCAVIAAVENGDLDDRQYQNFLKLEREKAHFNATVHEKRKKEKEFGKMVKSITKHTDKRKRD